MKVLKLKASNFMNLEFVELELDEDGNVVILYGDNGSGKTNVLKVIDFGLSGKSLNAAIEPVMRGQKSGEIVLDLGEIIVVRKFTNDSTSSLIVKNSEDMVYKSPQKLLDGFRGKISFNPMGFADMSEKKQKEVFLSLIDLPIDLDELEQERKKIYESRTLVNREVKQLEGQLAGIPDLPDVPDDEMNIVDILDRQQKANDQIVENEKKRTELNSLRNERISIRESQENINAQIIELQDKADNLIIELATQDHTIATLNDEVKELMDPDLEAFKCQLEDVEEINKKVRQKNERNKLFHRIKEVREISSDLKTDIKNIDNLKSKTIQEANMPVPGLGFDENGVTFEDIPLSQRSDAEKRKISMAIGMAFNPNIKVMWVTDASLLDKESMKDVAEMAKKHGYQIWLERIEPGDYKDVAIHIKEGKVVS